MIDGWCQAKTSFEALANELGLLAHDMNQCQPGHPCHAAGNNPHAVYGGVLPLSTRIAQLVAQGEWFKHKSLIEKHVQGSQSDSYQLPHTDSSKPTVVLFLGGP